MSHEQPAEALGMKAPKYAAVTMQMMSDAGLNPFAARLLAESHADKPERFGDETIMLVADAHNGTPVYILLSTRRPTLEQFKDWPTQGQSEAMCRKVVAQSVCFGAGAR